MGFAKTRLRWIRIMVLSLFIAQTAWAMTGREIMDKNDMLPEPKTGKSQITMYIHKGSRVIEKEFEILTKKYPDDEDKTLISFHRPTQIKLLTHSHKNRDDDQWLRLSSGRIKRIATTDKDKPFVNSHFYYEDLTSRDIDEYTYKNLGEEPVMGQACYKVEAVRNKENRVYSKSILYVRKSDFFIIRIDLYIDGEFHKSLENHDIKKVSGILTPFRIIMSRADGKGKTELKVKSVAYNTPVSNAAFNKEALR